MNFLIDFLTDILIDFLDLIAGLIFTPIYSFNKVTDITDEELDRMKKLHGIKGIILDVDETIRFDMQSVPDENDKWIDNIRKSYKVVVLTNGLDDSIVSYFEGKEVKVIHSVKPLKKYFKMAMNELDLKPEEILVIGDNPFTDIFGGNKMNMVTCKIKRHKGHLIKK